MRPASNLASSACCALAAAVGDLVPSGPGRLDDAIDFDLLAASLRSSGGDVTTFVDVLAEKLERALPGRVKVARRAVRFLAKEKHVATIECQLGERRYLLAARSGTLETREATAVRGVVLKSEVLPLDAWIEALAGALAAEAGSSEQSRLALERMLRG
jgi:hypothetical protein